jgi:hypothetical protein
MTQVSSSSWAAGRTKDFEAIAELEALRDERDKLSHDG